MGPWLLLVPTLPPCAYSTDAGSQSSVENLIVAAWNQTITSCTLRSISGSSTPATSLDCPSLRSKKKLQSKKLRMHLSSHRYTTSLSCELRVDHLSQSRSRCWRTPTEKWSALSLRELVDHVVAILARLAANMLRRFGSSWEPKPRVWSSFRTRREQAIWAGLRTAAPASACTHAFHRRTSRARVKATACPSR